MADSRTCGSKGIHNMAKGANLQGKQFETNRKQQKNQPVNGVLGLE